MITRIRSLPSRWATPQGLFYYSCMTSMWGRVSSNHPRCFSSVSQTDRVSFDEQLKNELISRLCDPDRPLPRRDIFSALTDPNKVLEELSHHTTSRRHAASRRCFHFLRRHNVLMHSLLFYEPYTRTWNTTKEFDRLVLYGESVLRSEVSSRLLKLFPFVSTNLYSAFMQRALHEPTLVNLFDTLALHGIVGSQPEVARWWVSDERDKDGQRETLRTVISPNAKCHMLFALVGEMSWFVSRTKASDRTHNNALFPPSDVLILHVLCAHLLQCVPAELLYVDMEPIIESVRSQWLNEPMSLPSQLMSTPHTLGVHLLNKHPQPFAGEPNHASSTHPLDGDGALFQLSPAPRKPIVSRMRPRINTKHMDALDNAFFQDTRTRAKLDDPSFHFERNA